MIDLHCHILPGLDDGPATIEESIAIARAATEAGISGIVATPHIREDYPFDPRAIPERIAAVEDAMAAQGIDIRLFRGGEVAITRFPDLNLETLEGVCLGEGRYMLVESPYSHATDLLEETLFELQLQGFTPVLAHPERCPSFHEDLGRVAGLVQRGVLCSVTAASMTGRFGRTVKNCTVEMFAGGLVHNVASDAHDVGRRPVDLLTGFVAMEPDLPGLGAHSEWFTSSVPEAIVTGRELPSAPPPPERPRKRRLRLFGR